MKHMMSERTQRFAGSLADFQGLSGADKGEIQEHHLPGGMTLKTYSIIRPQLEWTHQLALLLGFEEVKKLEVKLRSLNVAGRDRLRLTYEQLFTSPFLKTNEPETELAELLDNTGAWPQDGKITSGE